MAISKYTNMYFEELWERVHKKFAYLQTYVQNEPPHLLDYGALLDPNDPEYEEVMRDLRETSHEAVF